jgi:hypothetical protein
MKWTAKPRSNRNGTLEREPECKPEEAKIVMCNQWGPGVSSKKDRIFASCC